MPWRFSSFLEGGRAGQGGQGTEHRGRAGADVGAAVPTAVGLRFRVWDRKSQTLHPSEQKNSYFEHPLGPTSRTKEHRTLIDPF